MLFRFMLPPSDPDADLRQDAEPDTILLSCDGLVGVDANWAPKSSNLPRGSRAIVQEFREPVEEADLARDELSPCCLEIEPSGPVDLRELTRRAGTRWPLDSERVALDDARVHVPLKGERL